MTSGLYPRELSEVNATQAHLDSAVMDEEFLTVAQIAELLKVNPQTVYNTIERGDLPAVRFGPRRVRVRRVDLEQFIATSSEKAARPSKRRVAFDVAVGNANQALKRKTPGDSAVAALRRVSEVALALADELETKSG